MNKYERYKNWSVIHSSLPSTLSQLVMYLHRRRGVLCTQPEIIIQREISKTKWKIYFDAVEHDIVAVFHPLHFILPAKCTTSHGLELLPVDGEALPKTYFADAAFLQNK